MNTPEIPNENIPDQSQRFAASHMSCAVYEIDSLFGDGYAKAHPELVMEFMRTASTETMSTILFGGLFAISDAIKEATHDNR